jgi:hypothetical protein
MRIIGGERRNFCSIARAWPYNRVGVLTFVVYFKITLFFYMFFIKFDFGMIYILFSSAHI